MAGMYDATTVLLLSHLCMYHNATVCVALLGASCSSELSLLSCDRAFSDASAHAALAMQQDSLTAGFTTRAFIFGGPSIEHTPAYAKADVAANMNI